MTYAPKSIFLAKKHQAGFTIIEIIVAIIVIGITVPAIMMSFQGLADSKNPEFVIQGSFIGRKKMEEFANLYRDTITTVCPEGAVAVLTQGGNYRIQVYSLKIQAEADEHVAKLITGGVVSTGQNWYIVYVGPFRDINSAKVNLKALKFSGRKPILLSVSTAG